MVEGNGLQLRNHRGFESRSHLYLYPIIMEETKHNRICFEEDYDDIIHPDYRNVFRDTSDAQPTYGNELPEEEFRDSGFAVIYCIIGIAFLAAVALISLIFIYVKP